MPDDAEAAVRTKRGVGAIIVAAGRSLRMGGGDKIWVSVGGRPLLAHTVSMFQFCSAVDKIALVLSSDRQKLGLSLIKGAHFGKVTEICFGGEERQQSVRAGLEALGPCEWVIVHDGARPLVTTKLIEQGLAAARQTGAATCAVPVHDTLKLVNERQIVEKSLERNGLWLIQTPQVFRYDLLMEAHRKADGRTFANDDAALVERMGYEVKVFMGSYHNIKVTTPEDLVLAQMLLKWHRM
ncbi:MAG: 2-C-methyl-D-erythritol 4-phosphate cytidylyltransferase [Dehalococcoidia bacterium]|jgi:2-C-methyl-D-erythritol 4-phosphate cytidylyltransferase